MFCGLPGLSGRRCLSINRVAYTWKPTVSRGSKVYWRFFCSWSTWPKSVAISGGKFFNTCLLLRPGHVRKFTFLIAFSKVLGVGLKQHTWRYWINYVFVLSLVMIAWAQCLNGFDMGMYHKQSVLFLCPLKRSVLFLEYWSHSGIIWLCSHYHTVGPRW